MYNKEQKFTARMVDFHRMCVPQRYNGDDWKFNHLLDDLGMPEYFTPYDQYDPYIIESLWKWTESNEVVKTAVPLGTLTPQNCNIHNLTYDSNTNSYDFEVELIGDVYATVESDAGILDDKSWYIIEYINTSTNTNVVTVTTSGNYNIDSSGGLTGPFKSYGEAHYDKAFNTTVTVPHYFEEGVGYQWDVNGLHLGFRHGRSGDRIKIQDLKFWKVTPA